MNRALLATLPDVLEDDEVSDAQLRRYVERMVKGGLNAQVRAALLLIRESEGVKAFSPNEEKTLKRRLRIAFLAFQGDDT